MAIKKNSVYSVLVKTVVLILVLFLVTTPVFYWIISSNSINENSTNLYVTARIFRFIVSVVISCVIRKKNRTILTENILSTKKIFKLILGVIFISTLLCFHNTASDIYSTISYTIGIYDLDTTPLFLAVLWEQLFMGDLYWSILLGLSVVVFNVPITNKAQM